MTLEWHRFRPRSALRTLCLAAALAGLSAPVGAQDVTLLDGRRVLSVSGEGRAYATPDIAQVSLGVAAQADDASDALDQMGKSVESTLAVLEGLGVDLGDIQTEHLQLDQVLSYDRGDRPVPQGFRAVSVLSVTVRTIGDVGVILDRVVDGGVTQINGVTFGVSDTQDLLDDARRDAVADATRRAEVFANAAGVELGEIVALTESSSFSGPGAFIEQAARDVPVALGNVALTAGARITFEIEE